MMHDMESADLILDKRIYESASTLVHRGRADGRSVIVKTLKPGAAGPSALSRYHHEFSINQSLTSPYVVRAIGLSEADHRILFEDIEAESLRELIRQGNLGFEQKLSIAIQLCQALQSIHDEGVIHRDINPSNVVCNPEQEIVRLIDFGLATLAPREYPDSAGITNLTGTLPYVSPEQTGRVNRVVDYRTDLYSLGATLHELFTGTPPFTSTDPLELIHSHIARLPKLICELNTSLPTWLSEIVAKLLAKQPEDRYQSAAAARSDLEEGYELWISHANVETFPLGRTDARSQLTIPKRLYGRDAQSVTMETLLQRVSRGEVAIARLLGPPGMGKTAFVDVMVADLGDRHGLTARIKLAPGKAGDGFAIIRECCSALVRQMLSRSSDDVNAFLTRLRRRSADPQALAQLIPELAGVFGVQDDGVDLSSATCRQCLQDLLGALSPTPVALILERYDRMPTRAVAEALSLALQGTHLLVVLTSERPPEPDVDDARILAKRTDIELGPLDKNHLRSMLADTLSQSEARVREFSAEIHAKTDGVPAQVLELLFELHDQNSLYYDSDAGHWAWSIDEIRAHFFSDNTRERIERQLSGLPEDTLSALEIGACCGEFFELGLLAKIAARSDHELATSLRRAVSVGLLVGARDDRDHQSSYQFAHPRVRALIYGTVDEHRKADIHLLITSALIESDHDGDNATLIADHFNAGGGPFDTHTGTRDQVAHYNLAAARTALRDGAFQPAFKYARSGLSLFTDQRSEPGGLLEALLLSAAEAAFLCGDFDQLDRVFNDARRQLPDSPAALNELQVRTHLVRNDLELAIAAAQSGLRALPYTTRRFWWPFQYRIAIRPLGSDMPTLHDPRLKQAFRLMAQLLHAGYHAGALEMPNLAADILIRSRTAGYSGEAAFAFAAEAVRHVAAGKTDTALVLANNARQLAHRYPDDIYSTRALTLLPGLVDHWTGNLDQTLALLTENTRKSMANHDYEFALVGIVFYAVNSLLRGTELTTLHRELGERLDEVAPMQHVTAFNISGFIREMIVSLLGEAPLVESGDERSRVSNPDDQAALACIYTLRVYFAVLFNDYLGAENTLVQARQFIPILSGSPLQIWYSFCEALIASRGTNPKPRRLRAELKKLRNWQHAGCESAAPKASIIEAELARSLGRDTEALQHYETAAKQARQSGFANDEAMAYELAGRMCDESARHDFARIFLRNAHQAYLRWGAITKATQLERDFGSYLKEHHPGRPESGALTVGDLVDLTLRDFASVSGSYHSEEIGRRLLDTTTVLKAAQAISGEIILDQLLIKLLRIALEHAGAQKACLMLVHDDRLFVESIASVDGDATRRLNPALALEDCDDVPHSIVQFVARTKQSLVLADATREDVFTQDAYVKAFQPLSVMCLPISSRNEVIGVLYIEHRWLTGLFTSQRVEVLSLLASQAAISIENARLYSDLESTRDEYRALYDSANEGLFRITADGVLIRANPTLARVLEFDDINSLLHEYRDLVDHLFLTKERAQQLMSLLDEGGTVDGFEAEGVTRTGHTFWMSLNAQINHDPVQGEVIDGSVIDISARIERERAEQQRQVAEAASRAKSEFLANMSHEIRTPMNAIVGFSMLSLETELDHKQREYMTSIRNAAESLLTLVNDVLDFSKIEAGKLTLEETPFALQETLAEVQRLFRTDVRKKGLELTVTNRCSEHANFPANGILLGDGLRLRQILINLVGNAIKFTESGAITVEAQVNTATDSLIDVAFKVSDTGIGISSDEQARLFESFEQAETSTTRRFGGTGLGLTICRNLLDAMGGEIGVVSTPGTGSCFAFNVPFKRSRATLEVTPAPAVPRPRSADALAGAKVLLAEDNPINQQLALELLRRAGAVVDVAENGRIALERVQQKDYDIVLMDIHMPEMDGLEATQAIRDLGYTVPIIAVSADALEERQSRALEAGCDDYVTKPIDFDRLLGSVQRLLAKDRPATPRQRRASDPEPAIDERSILLSQRTPGINVGLAIRNHNGNVKLMLKLMGDFGEYYGDAGHRMRQAVSAGQLEDAERLAHNLHGVAGSFGAGHLKEASKSLEYALIAGDEGNLLGLINSFEIALTEVLESTQSLAGNELSFRASDFEESH